MGEPALDPVGPAGTCVPSVDRHDHVLTTAGFAVAIVCGHLVTAAVSTGCRPLGWTSRT
jgi:hypothetical protein